MLHFCMMRHREELPINRRLTALLRSLASREGIQPTLLEGVNLMRVSQPLPRMPVLYEPGIVIVGQGRKRGYLGDQVYTYDAGNYLVLSVPLPFECETEASPEKPLLAVSIRVDLAVLAELLMKMDGGRRSGIPSMPQGIYSTELDGNLTESTVRLLECLGKPVDARFWGRRSFGKSRTVYYAANRVAHCARRRHCTAASDRSTRRSTGSTRSTHAT